MKSDLSKVMSLAGLFTGVMLSLWSASGFAQGVRQITQDIDETQRVTLRGNTPPSASAKFDQGRVSMSEPANHMLLVLQRSAAQQAAVQKLIDAQHDPASPTYHQWLKPGEFGKQFGINDSDVENVKAWLQAKGFTVNKTNLAKTTIDFSGTAGQVENAFHTELHRYLKNGVPFHSNNKDPEIPAALAPVVKGIAALNDIKPKSFRISKGRVGFDPATHTGSSSWIDPVCYTDVNTGERVCYTAYFPTPADIATQYSLKSVYASGVLGKGVTLGIIGDSNVDMSNVQNYRNFFHIANSSNLPQTVIDGEDPGQNGDAEETYLDLEVSGALAPAAKINLYVSGNTITTPGLFTAMARAVEDDTADVISMSYGECEKILGSAGNQFFYYAWEQAAAQGQSVFVSSGDSGSAGCDNADYPQPATQGLAVSGFASTPYNVAVGGTDFYYSAYKDGNGSASVNAQLAQYWGKGTTSSETASLTMPIPEQPWNDFLGPNILTFASGTFSIAAGSGGPSTCTNGTGVDPITGGYDSCTSGYPKPSWQKALGMPNNGRRNLPDVSLFAADGANLSAWPICVQAEDCTTYKNEKGGIYVTGVGGTSASSPAMAGIMALIDQSQAGRQGNPNVMLYALAQQYPNSFNDITVGSNKVLCEQGSPNCAKDKNGYGFYTDQKYSATAGYDLATGLGSVNGANLIANWKKLKFAGTTTSLALSSTRVTHGTPITAYVSVFSPEGTPTGSASLITNSRTPTAAGQGLIPLVNGTGSAPFYLPGGTYDVFADYSGDGEFSASDSSPAGITIAPEPSTITLTASAAVPDMEAGYSPTPITNGSTFQYGYTLSFDATVAGKSGQGTPTGTVNYVDYTVGPRTIGLENINSYGVAEFNTFTLGAGYHVIGASYGGDPSFKATSQGTQPATLSFTITKGTPYIYPEDESEYGPIYSGQTFSVPFLIAGSNGLAPTGSVTVTYGSQVQQVKLIPVVAYGQPFVRGTAVFQSPAPGAYTVTIQYAGDDNYVAASSYPETITVVAPMLLPSHTTLTSSTLSAGNNGTFTLTATVTGNGKVPLTTGVLFYLNGQPLEFVQLTNGKASLTLTDYNLFTGKNIVTAEYLYDPKYDASTSRPVTITGNEGDFTVGTSDPNLQIAAGDTATEMLVVSSLQGLGGQVAMTCASPSPALVCSINPSVVNLDPYGKQSYPRISIYAAQGAPSQTHTIAIRASDGGVVHTMALNVTIK